MKLDGIVPLDQTQDYAIAYLTGQRTARANAYLTKPLLKNVAVRRLGEASQRMRLNALDYLKGFIQGYIDERDGLAHPLPANDVPYQPDEIYY